MFSRVASRYTNVRVSQLVLKRMYTSEVPVEDTLNLRKKLTTELKNAMKSKDSQKSMVIRSVLSEIYNAEKAKETVFDSTHIVPILRKAIKRRGDAAEEFSQHERKDLAEKELAEKQIIEEFLPAQIPVEEIDEVIKAIVKEHGLNLSGKEGKKSISLVMGKFFEKVDKNRVDRALVSERLKHIAELQKDN
ncbi:Yqey-like protein-domain-containing protein [Abortiporus biennis]|nr:Yqey-like protein-domain-containing protein [Abortiporus biennis]